ncbi:flavin reductase family protein [Frankia sp. KB5]|uniref:flavin reductase family protein n=1 Tax=Frankia sp. KB5 TaxID=683318 RepID=UPI000A122D2D|nr:flavin reductase family protein [Frankia sp. KB5]ORT48061.1 flavin reductase [Frankia sp. KB5]
MGSPAHRGENRAGAPASPVSPVFQVSQVSQADRSILRTADFRRAVGRFATGVTVLTTVADGRHLGMTANSFVSVSLDPLLVLASIRRDARFHGPLMASGVWGVSVLAEDMAETSRCFAKRAYDQPGDMFAGWEHSIGPETGVVLFDGALSVFECRTVTTHPGGDHTLVLGEVVSFAQPRDDVGPLVFYDGRYLDPGGADTGGTEAQRETDASQS